MVTGIGVTQRLDHRRCQDDARPQPGSPSASRRSSSGILLAHGQAPHPHAGHLHHLGAPHTAPRDRVPAGSVLLVPDRLVVHPARPRAMGPPRRLLPQARSPPGGGVRPRLAARLRPLPPALAHERDGSAPLRGERARRSPAAPARRAGRRRRRALRRPGGAARDRAGPPRRQVRAPLAPPRPRAALRPRLRPSRGRGTFLRPRAPRRGGRPRGANRRGSLAALPLARPPPRRRARGIPRLLRDLRRLADRAGEQVDPGDPPGPRADAPHRGGDHRLPAPLPGLGDVRAQPDHRGRHRGRRRADRRRAGRRSVHRQGARPRPGPCPDGLGLRRLPQGLTSAASGSIATMSTARTPASPEISPGCGTTAAASRRRTSWSRSTSTGSALSAPALDRDLTTTTRPSPFSPGESPGTGLREPPGLPPQPKLAGAERPPAGPSHDIRTIFGFRLPEVMR